MIFDSLQYFVFLALAWAVFRAAPVSWRPWVLLVASYFFYASWSAPYAAGLLVLVVLNYVFGVAIGRVRSHRGIVLTLCVGVDLSLLGFFKYSNFLTSTFAQLGGLITGRSLPSPILSIALPLGISFFTFEFIHYLSDIYRGGIPEHNFTKFHVFAVFFPTQIAGPIKRFQQFVPTLSVLDRFDPELAKDGLRLIGIGLAKKILIADKVAPMADAGFARASLTSTIGTAEAWLATLAFAMQIYFDFSGYTDIARGSAQLFGFRVPLNFDDPYLATRIANFWPRWHMSLSTWLRDYIFIPLELKRARSRARKTAKPGVVAGLVGTSCTLMITMTLGGLWHGAAWHFVVWGAYWGLALGIDRIVRGLVKVKPWPLQDAVGWLVTQLVVLFSWVLFRGSNLATAEAMFRAMLHFQPSMGMFDLTYDTNLLLLTAVFVVVTVARRNRWWPRYPLPSGTQVLKPLAYGIVTASLILYIMGSSAPFDQRFIYFQF